MEILVSGRLTTFKKLIIYIYISKGSSQPRFQMQALCFIRIYIYKIQEPGRIQLWGHKESDTTKRLNTLAIYVCVCVCVCVCVYNIKLGQRLFIN